MAPMTGDHTPSVARRSLLGGALGLLALGGLPTLTGCGSSAATPTQAGTRALAVSASREQVSVSSAADLAEVVAGMRGFSTGLHAASATETTNWAASPLSIAVAFAMLRGGSRGTTATQLDTVFGWPRGSDPQGSPHQAFNALTADLLTAGPPPTDSTPADETGPPAIVAVANGLFVDTGFAVREEFLRLLATQYGAEATAVSFADPSASATINAWVRAQTQNRIQKLFDDLDRATRLVLANAVYLKATWAWQFESGSTTRGAFHTATGGQADAELMHRQITGAVYDEQADWQRIWLPYLGGELAMRVVLPRQVVRDVPTLTALLAKAAEPSPNAGPARSALVDLTLPKWDTATTLSLLAPLRALGLTDLGDLSGIAAGLGVSDAIHRANVTVDEEGTEAAAVTGIATDTSAMIADPVSMTVDRPFAWAIVHEPTGTPVFTGHVVDPTS